MKKRIYLDTSIISAYYDDRKPDRQRITQKWWDKAKENFELYISEIVEFEVSMTSDREKREKLINHISGISSFGITTEVRNLANEYIRKEIFIEENLRDALHIAVATLNNIDIVVSWNFHHIVTYETSKKVKATNILIGYREIDITSPLELGGGEYE